MTEEDLVAELARSQLDHAAAWEQFSRRLVSRGCPADDVIGYLKGELGSVPQDSDGAVLSAFREIEGRWRRAVELRRRGGSPGAAYFRGKDGQRAKLREAVGVRHRDLARSPDGFRLCRELARLEMEVMRDMWSSEKAAMAEAAFRELVDYTNSLA